MTEKRFSCTKTGFVVDYESEQKVLNLYDTVDCLNELSEENRQLKSILQETIDGLEATFKQDEDTFYAVTLVVNLDMFHTMKEIMG